MKTIVVTGHDRVGKTSFSMFFYDIGYAIYEAGSSAREEYIRCGFSSQISEFYSLHQNKIEKIILNEAIVHYKSALKEGKSGCVLVGLRSSTLLLSIKKLFPDTIIIYIESSIRNRFKRYRMDRYLRTYEPKKNLQEFLMNDKIQIQWGLRFFKANADHIISNNGSLQEFKQLFELLTNEHLYYSGVESKRTGNG